MIDLVKVKGLGDMASVVNVKHDIYNLAAVKLVCLSSLCLIMQNNAM